MVISLSDKFNYGRLLRFTLPSIIMMVFTSVYGVVDGFFVSNYAGKTPFAALNFIMPFLMILGPIGFMFGTGGSALIAKTLGEGSREKANSLFSLLVAATVVCSVIISVLGIIFIRPIAAALGAEGEMLDYCVLYGRILLLSMPFQMLQFEFQSFFVTAEVPKLGLICSLFSGIANMVMDFVFLALLRWGLAGAALATAISQIIGGIFPIIYFLRENSSLLQLTKPKMDFKALVKTCTNGSSELMSNISMSLVGMLYNVQLINLAGQDGVAAYGVIMYVNFIFISAFIGYSIGVAPVISYNLGAQNFDELKSLKKKSTNIIAVFSVCMFLMALFLAKPLASIFVSYDKALFDLTVHAFIIYSFSFLFAGFAIFGSSFFTALNDGLISAIISFLRTLVFQVAAVLLLPLILGLDGIWYSIIASEALATLVTALFIILKRKKYRY